MIQFLNPVICSGEEGEKQLGKTLSTKSIKVLYNRLSMNW